jgi:phosphoenolpyruvate synthase/pyruvate phosphate dikinase
VRTSSEFIRSLDDLSEEDARLVGVHASNLAELRKRAFPVSDSFIVTTSAFETFSHSNGLEASVWWFAERAKAAGASEQESYSRMIEVVIRSSKIPDEVREAVLAGYRDLRRRSGTVTVLARSSFPVEVSSDPSFLGQRSAFFDLMSEEELLAAVKRCWASAYDPSAIRLWSRRLTRTNLIPCAVVVQEQAPAGPDLFGWGGAKWGSAEVRRRSELELVGGLPFSADHHHR